MSARQLCVRASGMNPGGKAARGGCNAGRRPRFAAVVGLAVLVMLPPVDRVVGQLPQSSARTGIFGLEARGMRFVYVFDRSASMGEPGGRPLAIAKRELLRSLGDLGDNQQFHIIFYNERQTVFAPTANRGRPIFASPDTKLAAEDFIEAIRAEGGTRHYEAIVAATRLAPDAIFVLTDADAGDDLTADELARLQRLLGGARCLVAQFSGEEHRRSPRLAQLAADSGGEYRVVDDAGGATDDAQAR